MDATNLLRIKAENIEALLVPSLRSFHLQRFYRVSRDLSEQDCEVFLSSLLLNHSITSLSLDFNDYFPQSQRIERLLVEMLHGAEQLEHLTIDRISHPFFTRWSPDVLLQKLLQHKPNLISLRFPRDLIFRSREVDTFLSKVGPEWSLPSLKEILAGPDYIGRMTIAYSNAPRFPTGQQAARLLDRMPNLEKLAISFFSGQRPFADGLACAFDSFSKLKHLEKLDVDALVINADLHGEWLTQLTTLSQLEHVMITVRQPRDVLITGAHMICLLESLPKLKILVISFSGIGPFDVNCSAEEKAAIENALEKIDEVDLALTFKIRDLPETEG